MYAINPVQLHTLRQLSAAQVADRVLVFSLMLDHYNASTYHLPRSVDEVSTFFFGEVHEQLFDSSTDCHYDFQDYD